MKELTLNELLNKLEEAAHSIEEAREALNDTGDFESDKLDEACTLAEKVARLIGLVYNELEAPTK